MSTEIVPQEKRIETLQSVMSKNNKAITSLLPAHVKPEMLMRTIFTAVSSTPKLLECSPASIIKSALQAAMLGLPPNDGRGLSYLVPYKNKGVSEAQLITGYRGLVLLARQAGDVGAIDCAVIHNGDEWGYEMGLNPKLFHRKSKEPAYKSDGSTLIRPIVASWCAASIKGERQFTLLEWWEIERIRNGSKGYQNAISYKGMNPWIEHPGAMAQKTAVRAQMKMIPGSSERLSMAQNLDDAHDNGSPQDYGIISERIEDPDRQLESKSATDIGDLAKPAPVQS